MSACFRRGNHQGFLNKPQALFEVGTSRSRLAALGRRVRDGKLALPPGCFANYDLAIIDFLVRLQGKGPATDYQALRDSRSTSLMSASGLAHRSQAGPARGARAEPRGPPRLTAARRRRDKQV